MSLQPIVDLESGWVVGHEALVRGPAGSAWESPAALAQRARDEGCEPELEARCRRLALEAGRRLPLHQRLFINVDLRYGGALDMSGDPWDARRLAIEVSERQSLLEDPAGLERLQAWRSQGYTLVLDDYGTGHASLGALLALQPDCIKVDRFIISGVDREPRRQRALAALLEMTRDLGIALVAEGIETEAELRTLRAMGVLWGQGFLLARPSGHVQLRCRAELLRQTAPPQRRAPAPPCPLPAGTFHEALFSGLRDGVYYVDRRRTILRWNPAAEAITGFPAQELVGRRCMRSGLGHRDRAGRPLCAADCPLVHTMADGAPRSEVITLRHRQGHRIPVRVDTIPVRGPDGQIAGAVEVFRPLPDDPVRPPIEG
jgi:PAS domain S-box-containing protein